MSARGFPELVALLHRIDGRGYKAYREIEGKWTEERLTLFIDRAQGDPFAAPSRVRIRVPGEIAGFPEDLFATGPRDVAFRDFLTRRFAEEAERRSRRYGTGGGGLVTIDRPGPQVLERSSCLLVSEPSPGTIEARFVVGLPAAGRRVLGRDAAEILAERIPAIAERALRFEAIDLASLRQHVETVENAAALRGQLDDHGLVAFIADGSILPRRSVRWPGRPARWASTSGADNA